MELGNQAPGSHRKEDEHRVCFGPEKSPPASMEDWDRSHGKGLGKRSVNFTFGLNAFHLKKVEDNSV